MERKLNKLTTLNHASCCGPVVFMLYYLKTLVKPNIEYYENIDTFLALHGIVLHLVRRQSDSNIRGRLFGDRQYTDIADDRAKNRCERLCYQQ